jgi:ribosomal protein L21E
MFEAQRVLLDTAQRLQQQKDARHMEATTSVTTRFDVGSYVLISYNPQKMNAKPPTKLHPRLKVVANVQGDKYSCQNLVTDEIDSHVTKLREFRYDERYVDPRDIALRDRDKFYVEKILVHRSDVGRLKTLAFHVKWRGFDESFKSWEPWKNLRETTEMLHRYLILHGLQKLIPAKFRERYPELAVGHRRLDRMWQLVKKRKW